MSKIQNFKKKLAQSATIGCFSKTTDSSVVEVMAQAGLDFVILDMEHGPITTETLKHHLMAFKESATLSIVRVENASSDNIGKALDLGAQGVQIPSVSTVKQAEKAVEAAKFHPMGMRGVCRFVRAAEYSIINRNQYFEEANETLLILQLEGTEGLAAFDDIIAIEGIDVIFVGPYDLSQSLGVTGQVEHPLVMQAIEQLVTKAALKNVVLGTFCDTPSQLHLRKSQGLKYLAYSVDLALFAEKIIDVKQMIA